MFKIITTITCGVALLAACGNGDEPSSAPAPPTYSAEQLDAALPGVDDVPGATKVTRTCPGEEHCEDADAAVSVSMELRPGGTDEQAEAAANEGFGDGLSLNAQQHPDEPAAEADIVKLRKIDEEQDGDFEVKPEDRKGPQYTPGQRGTGSVADTRVDGWSGYAFAKTFALLGLDGKEFSDRVEAQVAVSRGGTTVYCAVWASAAGQDRAQVLDRARTCVEKYLDELG